MAKIGKKVAKVKSALILPEGFSLTPKRTGLGFSVEDDRIIAVQADISPKGILVTSAYEQILEPATFSESRVADIDALISSFKELKKKAKLSAKKASINLPANFYSLRKFDVPDGYFSQNPDNLLWEAEQHIVDSISDYRVSSFTAGKNGLNETAILAYARIGLVEERAGILRNAGYSPVAVEPDILAIYNAYIVAFGDFPSKSGLIVDVSAPYSSFGFVVDGVFFPGKSFYTSHGVSSGDADVFDFADELVETFNSVYQIAGYRIGGKGPEMVFVGGKLASGDMMEKIAQRLKIPYFTQDAFATQNIKMKKPQNEIPWQRLVKPLGLALRK